MRVRETVEHVGDHRDGRRGIRPTAGAQMLGERRAIDQFAHEVAGRVVLAEVQQAHDPRVGQQARRAHLRARPPCHVELDGDLLDGHLLAGPDVERAVHDRSSSPAEDGPEAVPSEDELVLFGGQTHRRFPSPPPC